MATAKLSDEALLAFFQDHPELHERMASIVATVGNAGETLRRLRRCRRAARRGNAAFGSGSDAVLGR